MKVYIFQNCVFLGSSNGTQEMKPLLICMKKIYAIGEIRSVKAWNDHKVAEPNN